MGGRTALRQRAGRVRILFFFSSRRRHTRFDCDWSSDVCSSDLGNIGDPHELYGSRLPLGRIATEDEIGRVALFLASDLAAIMTGSVVAADGGDQIGRASCRERV